MTTTGVLDAYDRSDADGKKAFNTADVASGIRPPDVEELRWELRAYARRPGGRPRVPPPPGYRSPIEPVGMTEAETQIFQ